MERITKTTSLFLVATFSVAILLSIQSFANEPIKEKSGQVNIEFSQNNKKLFDIQETSNSHLQVVLMDANDHVIFHQFIETSSKKFDLCRIPEGEYSLYVYIGKKTIKKSVIVKNIQHSKQIELK